jgi:hypothetical protein
LKYVGGTLEIIGETLEIEGALPLLVLMFDGWIQRTKSTHSRLPAGNGNGKSFRNGNQERTFAGMDKHGKLTDSTMKGRGSVDVMEIEGRRDR